MIIAVDFDDCVAYRAGPDLLLVRGAKEALRSLKQAGHVLLLWSDRTNRARHGDATLDPLVRSGDTQDAQTMETRAAWAEADLEMRSFVDEQLPGIFDAVDDGQQGAPCVDLYLGGRKYVQVTSWRDIAGLYGDI